MKLLLAMGAALLLAACVPAPVRPPAAARPQPDAQALAAAKQREALREAELARERAELRRREAEARQPRAGAVSVAPSIAAQPLEPAVEPAVAPAVKPPQDPVEPTKLEAEKAPPAKTEPAQPAPVRIDTWQLSNDLRRLQTRADVQTFYNERGWVVSLPAASLFEPGALTIREGGQDTLDRLARVLRHYAARGIVMEGPDAERAEIVKRALVDRGIPESGIGIQASGVGERVEFVVPPSNLNAGTGR